MRDGISVQRLVKGNAMLDLPRFYVWDDTRRTNRYMVWDREARYIDSMQRKNTGDFLRDAAGRAFLYETREAADFMVAESLKLNPAAKTTSACRV